MDWYEVRDLLFSERGIVDLIVAAFAALLAFMIAAVFIRAQLRSDRKIARQQQEADRDLARDGRLADAAHEIAGELAQWCSEVAMPNPRGTDLADRPASARPVLVLTRRRAFLETTGFADVLERTRKALEDFEAGWRNLATAVKLRRAYWKVGGGQDLQESETDIWQSRFAPAVEQIRSLSDDLSTWAAGSPVPALGDVNIPEQHVIEMELDRETAQWRQLTYELPAEGDAYGDSSTSGL